MPKIIFLHNKRIFYRLPLFDRLSGYYKDNIDFWFYQQKRNKLESFLNFSFTRIVKIFFEKYDILLLSGSHSFEIIFFFLISKLRKKKIVFWTESWNWPKMNFKNKFFLGLIKFISRHSDKVIYPGIKVREMYTSLSIPPTKQIFAPNASFIDVNSYQNIASFPKFLKQDVVYGFIGRILPRKGLMFLLKAFNRIKGPNLHLVIGGVGHGTYFRDCLELIRKSSRIHYIGGINFKQMGFFLNRIDVLVYPSIVRNGMAEPWGLTVNEAIQFNIPIITTSVVAAGFDLIKEGENGIVIPYEKASHLEKYLTLPLRLNKNKMVMTNEIKLKTYNFDKMSAGFIKAINEK